jgi:predicted deacylase
VGRHVEHIRADLGTAGQVSLPVLVHTGDAPGRTIAVTANVHGDELTGLLAVHALDRMLDAAPIRGRVLLYPSLNPAGLAAGCRAVPADGGDLNRAFPGRRTGSAVERLAYFVWRHLGREEADVLLDLHADSLASVPYVIVDRMPRVARAEQPALRVAIERLAEQTALFVLHEYADDEYTRYRLDCSLAGAFVNLLRRPAVTVEAGGRGIVASEAVERAVGAVCRVLAALDVASLEEPASARPGAAVPRGPWRRGKPPRARCDGVLVRLVSAGVPYAEGAALAEVRDVAGGVLDVVRAPAAGVVVSWTDGLWVRAATAVATVAVRGA